MTPILTTDRLYLRYFVENDLETLYAYRNRPEVARYQGWSYPYSQEECRQFLQTILHTTISSPSTQIAIIRREGNIHIGDIYCARRNKTTTIGYTISPDFWRQGYAYEALNAFIAWIHLKRPDDEIVAMIEPKNQPSIALIEKLGFCREEYIPSFHSYIFVKNYEI